MNTSLTAGIHCTPNDVDITAVQKMADKPAEKGQHVRHMYSLNRDKLANVPVTAEELKLMSDQLVGFSGARSILIVMRTKGRYLHGAVSSKTRQAKCGW